MSRWTMPAVCAASSPSATPIAKGSASPMSMQGYQSQYPYLAYHFQEFFIDGTPPCCDGEGTMDLEWSTTMANSFGSFVDTAMIYLYDGVNSNFSTFQDMYNKALSDGLARVLSSSYGCAELDCEPSVTMSRKLNSPLTRSSAIREKIRSSPGSWKKRWRATCLRRASAWFEAI